MMTKVFESKNRTEIRRYDLKITYFPKQKNEKTIKIFQKKKKNEKNYEASLKPMRQCSCT